MAYLTEKEISEMGFMEIGKDVRISDCAKIYNPEKVKIGNFTRIDDFAILSGAVEIGRNVHIAVHSTLNASSNKIVLEDFSGISFGCHLFAASEDYSGIGMVNPTVPKKFRVNVAAKDITLGRHVVIGASSVVFPGVNIAEGCAIGANSTVVKSTLPWGIYVGSPSRRIKERSKKILELEQEYLRESGT